MPLQIRNSLTKDLQVFEPLEPKKVKMYVCGPTVYDEPHIGHLRSAYTFDIIRNYLCYSGYAVTMVRNVTDVDDKIIDKAREEAGDLLQQVRTVSEKYHALYLADLAKLGVSPPDIEPKATTHIQEMQNLIQKLIQKGHAYESAGDVYFDVNSFKDYGKLSHQNKEAILQNVRIDKNEKKKDVLDFALWKRVKEGEPSWPSPWGDGRPGWHIECSAMSMKYLGETFDIHGGGRDLIFPHHENEIAQSEAATGKTFARYWLHHGLVTVNAQKMSKSLKNFTTLSEIKNQWPDWSGDEIKLLFLGTHYGKPLDYSSEKMEMEREIWKRFYHFFYDLGPAASGKADEEWAKKYDALFREAMDDDFNTSQALTVMHEMVHKARASKKIEIQAAAAAKLKEFGKLFGIFSTLGESGSVGSAESLAAESAIRDRALAKKNKDYKKADQIRLQLLEKHKIELIDGKDGTTSWRKV